MNQKRITELHEQYEGLVHARRQAKDDRKSLSGNDKSKMTRHITALTVEIDAVVKELGEAPKPIEWSEVWDECVAYRDAVVKELHDVKADFIANVEKYGVTYVVENSANFVKTEQTAAYQQRQLLQAERAAQDGKDGSVFVGLVVKALKESKAVALELLISQAKGSTWTCDYRNAVEHSKTQVLADLASGSSYSGTHYSAYNLMRTYDQWLAWDAVAK